MTQAKKYLTMHFVLEIPGYQVNANIEDFHRAFLRIFELALSGHSHFLIKH
mgnify:CR=1 FL=1